MACLRGGTRVDVVWNLAPDATPQFDPSDALAITPGGGRIGSLFAGTLDGQLVDLATVDRTRGRIVRLTPSAIEAQQLGQEAVISCALVPATQLPESLWPLLVERATVAVIASLDGDDIIDLTVATDDAHADSDIAALLRKGEGTVVRTDDTIVTVFAPRPTLVAFGPGDIPAAISALAEHFGWSTLATNNAGEAAAMASTLSTIDGVVVVGHDAEMTGRVLGGALSGEAGYVGSVGPGRVREAREEWLAYQGITALQRVHSPAGLDIGARTPNEIALAVIAEMVAAHNSGAS